ncbi:leucine-rich repeat domain-containing protein [Prevotella dentalis]|uniref:leucine-rich repeat domain-containing protein n=1 Tax=Prevotella dentalis TaxID=52227 RepID=UPI002659E247|nr:leucine-rich repeat domain-containing protein [Prevotella dentalis]MCF2638179.1 leucine-rich repeat domain-containing protein [Prevotella dentalis]
MTHKTFINICLTLIALCWTMAIQAQTATVDGINYSLKAYEKIAEVTKSTATGDIVIPEKITVDGVEYSVTSIGYEAFAECKALTSMAMPSVTSIGDRAFNSCSNLTSVDMPSVTSIGIQAFWGCSNLTSVAMPSVTSIGDGAFSSCSSLTSVDMSSVTSIDGRAFYSCPNLTSVTMPSVTSIGEHAFNSCPNLTSVTMPSVTSIGDGAFQNSPITNLSLPATLTSIGNSCFTDTREITLAATTPAVLGTDAFWKYAVIRVPESAVNDYRTAAGWSNYKDQILSMSDKTDYDVPVTAQEKESGLLNMITQDKLGKVVSLKVTGTINGYDIMIIHNKMPYLHHLDLTDATIVANDYEYYEGCHTEDNIIGDNMFASLYNLLSVKLPKNAISIRDGALQSCSNLVEVVLPVKLESIGGYAFNYCTNLTNIDLPPTLKTIGSYAFSYCSRLEKISLPGVEYIGGYAFTGCDKLTEVRIPSTLKSIGDNALDIQGLKKVYTYTVEPIGIGQETFAKTTYETGTLYIPKQSKNNYYWNTQWSQFAKLEEFDEPYKYFYLNKEYTLNDRFTGEPDIDINPGGGIIVPGKPELPPQDADTIHIKGDGKNWATIIANANLNAKGLYIDITIKANRWYFFSFPFKVRKADISCGKNVKFVFRTYNGAIRAEYGKGGWIDLDSSEEYLYPGKGYIFQASLDCTLSIKIEKSAFGKLPNVNVDTKLDIHTSTNEQNASWNFVGNPFTAFYDINDMGYNSPITRWNSDSNTYEAVRPGDDNAFLNPFEAFFVQCPKDNDDINFGSDNRLTQTGRDKKMNSQMQKARMEGQFDVQRQIVNLTLSDGTTTDKTRVVFNPDKKAGYERDCDAAKFESNGASELYTVEALAGRLAINERPEGSVKIGYRAAKAGEYTIAAQRMDRQVLLRDNDLQITFDLTQGDYHFTSDAGEFDNRFMLLIDNSTTGIGDIVTTTGVNVKPTDCGLNISNLQGKTLHVYALNGALYATRTQDGFLGLAKGVYLVEVEGLKAKFMVR